MSTREFEHDASRNLKEDLKTIRERLGKPASQNQGKDYKKTARVLSETINDNFKDKKRLIHNIHKVIDSHRQVGFPITPGPISLQTCYNLSRYLQRESLRFLAFVGHEKGSLSSKLAPALDVLTGFQNVTGSLDQAYSPTLDESGLRKLGINVGLVKQDPKGFLFVEDQAKFWSSFDRLNEGLIESYEDPRAIADGAELGARTYKRMHPIAEKVLSSGH